MDYKKHLADSRRTRAARFADGGSVMSDSAMDEDARRGRAVTQAKRDLGWGGRHQPVTIAEDVVGRFAESKGRDNAMRDAERDRDFDTIKRFGK